MRLFGYAFITFLIAANIFTMSFYFYRGVANNGFFILNIFLLLLNLNNLREWRNKYE